MKQPVTILSILLLVCVFTCDTAFSQTLREIEVTVEQTDRVFVFPNYPDYAALYIESSIPNLQVSSNLGIIADESEAGTGVYRIILDPSRQQVYFSAPGYIRTNFATGNLNARDVIFLRVEPRDRSITEVGTLLVRTEPAGATLRVEGLPGEHNSPHTFTNVLAQTYNLTIEKEDYETKRVQVRVDSERPNVETYFLTPSVGYLNLTTTGAQLFISTDEFPDEYRVSYTAGSPVKLDVGTYRYRVTRNHYQAETGRFEILPGVYTTIEPELQPDYATLRVQTNIRNFRLSARDNDAPRATQPHTIFLERGVRQVRVEADGYESQVLTIRAEAGAQIDTTITMLTLAEVRDRRQREQLPRGILTLNSDVGAEVFVNGEYKGKGEVNLTLVPDTYRVEMRHDIGNRRFNVSVPSADLVDRFEVFRPSKGRALTYSALLPGGGHLYTKRSRGFIYLGLFGAAAGFTAYNLNDHNVLQSDLDTVMASYYAASSVPEATQFREQADSIFNKQQSAYDQMMIGFAVLAGVYAIQLIDVALTNPRYGYRNSDGGRLQVGTGYGGVRLTYGFN